MESHPIHRVAMMFPAPSDDDMASLRESIEQDGVIQPILLWREQIVDGKTRYGIAKELGIDAPFESLPDTLEESQVVQRCAAINLSRRHLTSSQKAAIAVQLGMLDTEIERNATTEPEEGEKPRDAGAAVARQVGTNKGYVWTAKDLRENAPELLPQVASGKMTIPQAKRILNEPDEPASKSRVRGPTVADKNGKPVPPALVGTFVKRESFGSAINLVGQVRKTINRIIEDTDDDLTPFLSVGDIEGCLNDLRRLLKAGMPHAICPRCKASGTRKQHDCEACNGAGWVPKHLWDQIEKEKSS